MRNFHKIIILFVFINTGFVLNAKSYNSTLDTENTIEKKHPKDNTINLVLPTASITTNASSVCVGGTQPIITFTAGGSATSNYTFEYTIDDVTQTKIVTSGTNVATLNVPTTTAGSFLYKLVSVTEGTNSAESIPGQSVTISVNALPTATISTTTPTTFCEGSSVVLTANTGAGLSYVWKKDNTLFSPSQINSTYTATTSGNYSVTVTNSSGCSQTSVNQTVTVNPKPVVDFTFTDNQCSGDSVLFSTTSSGVTYTWNFGDGGTSSQQNPTHTYISFGCSAQSFNVSLTIIGSNGCSTTLIKPVIIKQQPKAIFIDPLASDPTDPTTYFNNCNSASVDNQIFGIYLSLDNSSSNCNSYIINWGDGTPNENLASIPYYSPVVSTNPPDGIYHNYAVLGTYTMSITSINSNGCNTVYSYPVKNISNPSGGIVSPGGTTNLCIPSNPLNFGISGWNNSPGTNYSVNWGDGNIEPIITQSQINAFMALNPLLTNYPVYHSYSTASCPISVSGFTVTLTISNSCGSTTATVNLS